MRAPLLLLLLLAACAPKLPPSPAITDGPAPPGRDDLVLRALHVADCHAQESQAIAGGGSADLILPVFSFVLEHPDAGLVVIDTGYPDEYFAGGRAYPGVQLRNLLKLEPRTSLLRALPAIGKAAADVDVAIVTHLHQDHGGGLLDLPDARLVVSAVEWDALGTKVGPFGDEARAWRDHAARTAITFDGGPVGPFEAHHDLFGDGSVLLLPTPGHTPGHLSVLVNRASHPVLFVGDAAWVDRHWMEPTVKGAQARTLLEHDWKQGVDALWRIRAWAKSWPELTIVSGHEHADLQRLPPWPTPIP